VRWLLELYPGDGFFELAINAIVQALVIVAVALLVSRFFLRRRPALRHAVWLSALVCVFLSPLLAWMWDAAGVSLISIKISQVEGKVDYYEIIKAEEAARDAVAETKPESDVVGVTGHSVATIDGETSADIFRIVLAVIFAIWALGAAFYTIRLIFGFGVHAALRRGVHPLEMENAEAVMKRVREILGISSLPPAGTSVLINSPVSIGIINSLVILPQSLAYSLSAEELTDVLVHEYAHIINKDHFVNLLQRLTGIFMWFHPFVRLMNRELATAREEVCDNYVLKNSRATSYSKTLLELAQKTTIFHRAPVTVGLAHPRWKLEDRVKGILDKERELVTGVGSAVFGTIATLFLCTVLLVAACRIVSANELSESEPSKTAGILISFGLEKLTDAQKELVEAEIEKCISVYEEENNNVKSDIFKAQILSSSEILKGIDYISYHLVSSLSQKREGDRENILALLLGGVERLATSAVEVDTIITEESGGKKKVKIALDQSGKSTILSSIESKLLSLEPSPETVLCLLAYNKKSKISLRVGAIAAIGSRNTVRGVESLIGLLQKSHGILLLETARTLRRLTGEDFGPRENDSFIQIEQEIVKWSEWWEKNERDGRYHFGW